MNIDLRSQKNRFASNPFVLELNGKMFLQPRANTIIAKGQNIVDTNTGEIIEESVLIGKRKIVDKSQFAKIYASEIAILYGLSKKAQNVFLHLTKIMDYDNKAFINAELHKNELGYKTRFPVNEAIKELIRNDIIAPAIMPNYYWLNPTIVCKGERFAMYTEFVVGKDGEQIKKFQESEIKRQGRNIIELMPESVENKIKASGQRNPIDSNNEEIHPNQGAFNFDAENPY